MKRNRLLDPIQKKIYVNRNVVFIEDRMYFSKKGNNFKADVKLVEQQHL